MKKSVFNILLIACFINIAFLSEAQVIENSYTVNQEVQVNGVSSFYVPVSGAPSNAIITNIEVKVDYIAFGVVQNYVACRFNKGSDPGTNGGVVFVSQGSLPAANPGTYGYKSFSNWNNQSSINTNYFFRFTLAAGAPFTCTINKIYVRISYSLPPPPPTLLLPSNGGVIEGPPYQFTWQKVNTAGAYQLKISDNTSFSTTVINDQSISGSATSYRTNVSLTPGKTYYWQMRTLNSTGTLWGDWGQYQSFTLQQSVLSPPTLLLPSNGGVIVGPPYQFTWQKVNTAGAYQLKISDNTSFSTTVINDQSISGSATSYQTNVSLTPGKTYYWQMRTLNSAGTLWGDWGQYHSFMLQQAVLPPPTLLSPINNERVADPLLQWEKVTGAIGYELEIDGNTVTIESGSKTSYLPSLSYGKHQWKARTEYLTNVYGNWSPMTSFYYVQNIELIDCNQNIIDDYPYPAYAGTDCTEKYSQSDGWGFIRYQCTSWVAFRINKYLNVLFFNQMYGLDANVNDCSPTNAKERLSNACRWDDILSLNGIRVDNIPSNGAIAHWDAYENGMGKYGHVGIVECVEGEIVTISNYNGWDGTAYSPCHFGVIYVDNSKPYSSSNRKPGRYIHIEDLCIETTGIIQEFEKNQGYTPISIFPNPASQSFSISGIKEPTSMKLIDISGKTVLIKEIAVNEQISISSLSKGIYMVVITNEHGVEVKKFIKGSVN